MIPVEIDDEQVARALIGAAIEYLAVRLARDEVETMVEREIDEAFDD